MKIIGGFVLAVLILAGCSGDSASSKDLKKLDYPVDDVRKIMAAAGLLFCSDYTSGGDISGSYEGTTLNVGRRGTPCPADETDMSPGLVTVNLYNDPAAAESAVTDGFGDALASWLVDPTTKVSITQSSRPEIVEIMRTAFADYPSGPTSSGE